MVTSQSDAALAMAAHGLALTDEYAMSKTPDIPQLASLADMREPVPVYIEQNIKRGVLDILDAQHAERAQGSIHETEKIVR